MNTASTLSGQASPYTPTVGDEVVLSGKVSEYYFMTELSNTTLVVPVIRSGVDIDAEVAPAVANPPDDLADCQPLLETEQGMRVQVPGTARLGGRSVFSR